MIALYILYGLITLYTAFSILYIFLFAIPGALIRRKQHATNSVPINLFAILVPGYKEDEVIISTARNLLKIDYPKTHFEIFIIADSFAETTLSKLKEMGVEVLEVSFKVSTKAKALNKAFEQIKKKFDLAIILDADNQVPDSFLHQLNSLANQYKSIVQTHRIAKNKGTAIAYLDAVSEEINNTIFRSGHRALGLSAALIGSGMMFPYKLIQSALLKAKAVGGFDKELELNLLKNKRKIYYASHIIVYDEKISHSKALQQQRRRWLSAQFIYLQQHFFPATKALLQKGNIDYFDKMLQMLLLPRSLLIGLTLLVNFLFLIAWLIKIQWIISPLFAPLWGLLLGILCLTLLISIPRHLYTWQLAKSLLILPKGIIHMFLAMIHIKGANKRFIHTQHGTDE